MKLARKLTLALVLGILLVLAANAAFRVRRELALFENDSRRDSLLLGRMLAGSVARLWPTIGEAQALDLVGHWRGSSVASYLLSMGFPEARLRTVSYGKERPQCTDARETCWWRNRRAHLRVLAREQRGLDE